MNNVNVLITGTPRSGTTMTCHLLNKLPNVVALNEPIKPGALKGRDGPAAGVKRFCDEQRSLLSESGKVVSKHEDGTVPANPFGADRSDAGLRTLVVTLGEIEITKELTSDFTLAIKHCGMFTALLDRLAPRFPIYAVVRNPLATLASWGTVDIPLQRGHVPVAERLDPDLKATLASIDDVLDRQIYVLAWFHERIRRYLPEEAIINYESIVESGGKALSAVHPSAELLSESLKSQNTSGHYSRQHMRRIGARLLGSDGAFWESYSRADVERLLEELHNSATP